MVVKHVVTEQITSCLCSTHTAPDREENVRR